MRKKGKVVADQIVNFQESCKLELLSLQLYLQKLGTLENTDDDAGVRCIFMSFVLGHYHHIVSLQGKLFSFRCEVLGDKNLISLFPL